MTAKFGNLPHLSFASRMRMLLNENSLKDNLQDDIMNTWRVNDGACLGWQQWHEKGIVATIFAAQEEGDRLGIAMQEVRKRLEEDFSLEGLEGLGAILKQFRKRKKATQRTILKMILQVFSFHSFLSVTHLGIVSDLLALGFGVNMPNCTGRW